MPQVHVRSFQRKGKTVRAFDRRNKNKNKNSSAVKKAVIGASVAAGVIGTSVATYLLLRKRFIHNLDVAAQKMTADPNVGEKLSDAKQNIVFTFGGFAKEGGNINEASTLNKAIKKTLGTEHANKTEFLVMKHNWSLDRPFEWFQEGSRLQQNFRYFTALPKPTLTAIAKGQNEESIRQAQIVFSWAKKNPDKQIKLIGISAGGQIVQDIQHILKQKGIHADTVTIGNFDNKMHDASSSLNLLNKHDLLVKPTFPRNATFVDTEKQDDIGYNHLIDSLLVTRDKTNPKMFHRHTKAIDPSIKHLKLI